jgi:hypothetical protein
MTVKANDAYKTAKNVYGKLCSANSSTHFYSTYLFLYKNVRRRRKCREDGEEGVMRSFITCTLHQVYKNCASVEEIPTALGL